MTVSIFKQKSFFPFVIALLGFLIYFNSLEVPFIFDDGPHIPENPHIRLEELTIDKLLSAAQDSPASRPVANISFALNYFFHGYDVTGYHIFNIAVHVLGAIFFFYFLLRTLSLPAARINPEYHFAIAGLASLIWLAHPIQTQSVTYIVQRMNSMAGMFYLLSLWLYVEARLIKRPWTRNMLVTGSILSAVMALGSKEIAITLPLVVYLYEWYFFQDLNTAWLRKSLKYVLLISAVFITVGWVYFEGSPVETILRMYEQCDFSPFERILTETRVIVFYVTLLLLPIPSRLNLDHGFTISTSLFDPITTFLALLFLIALLGTATVTAKRFRVFSFFIFWFIINLFLESSFIGLELIYEHRLYIPSCTFAVLFSYILIERLWKWRQWALVLSLVLIFFYGTATVIRNNVWKDELTLWSDAVSKNPASQRGFHNLGNALAAQGKVDEAIYHYKQAVSTNPKYCEIYVSLGAALSQKGDLSGAAAAFEKGLEMSPDDPLGLANLGLVRARQGRLDEAITYCSKAIKKDPTFVNARIFLGYALVKKGKLVEAKNVYSQILTMTPFDAEIHVRLGKVLLKLGEKDQAIIRFREALRINPNHVRARKQLRSVQGY